MHGSSAVLNKILLVLGDFSNCRIAEPGEFTRRAFENNKLDLTQVEALADLINSETEAQRYQAIKQLGGELSKKIKILSEKILKILANVEATIDFVDDELPNNIIYKSKEQIKNIHNSISHIIKDNKVGEKIREGFIVAIIGKTNVGKSSFINKVSKREVAIVTEDHGTTRDAIEAFIDFDGLPIRFFDTAGIRKAKNRAEKIGINKSYELSKKADINLIFIDRVVEIKDYMDVKNKIFVHSKIDIRTKIFSREQIINISSKNGNGIHELFNTIKNKLVLERNTENIVVSRERHREILNKTASYLKKSLLNKNIDLFAEDIRLATREISKITGKNDIEDILEIIFNDFCIGK